jgi:hypothetical protein
MNERKNYSKLSYGYDKWSYENSYNDVKVKESGKCKMFYTYDNHVGEARWCINCGQPEAEH